METTYRNRPSPYQAMKRQTYNVQSTEHPARREIKKLVGSYNIQAIVEEDTQTLATFKHVPGLVAFLCTLVKDGDVIGQGRGTAAFSHSNKFISRTIKTAFNGSLIDAMIRSTRVLDTFDEANEPREVAPITDKQKSYLSELVSKHVTGEFELEQWASQLESMSRNEASAAIEAFAKR